MSRKQPRRAAGRLTSASRRGSPTQMSFIINNFFYNWPCIQKRAGVALGHRRRLVVRRRREHVVIVVVQPVLEASAGACRGNAILVPSEVGPVLHDRRQDVGREARTAAKDGHEYGPVRARVGGKAAGGVNSIQILESFDVAARITLNCGFAKYLITSPEPVFVLRDRRARTQGTIVEQWYDAVANVAV